MDASLARSFAGLNSILESPKWTVAKACQAVEDCITINRCGGRCPGTGGGPAWQVMAIMGPWQAGRGPAPLLDCVKGNESAVWGRAKGSSWCQLTAGAAPRPWALAYDRAGATPAAGTTCAASLSSASPPCCGACLATMAPPGSPLSPRCGGAGLPGDICAWNVPCQAPCGACTLRGFIPTIGPHLSAHHSCQGGKEADAKALLKLLSPTGVLFSACYAADADGLIRFVFPNERLPTHTQARRGWAAMLGLASQPGTASTLQRRSAAVPSLHPACPASRGAHRRLHIGAVTPLR